jgi:hypothetical protein
VAIPTGFALSFLSFDIGDHSGVYKFGIELRVATHTVIHDDIVAGFTGAYNLRLTPDRKDGGMIQSVHRFESVLVENVILRDMAVVACSPLGM